MEMMVTEQEWTDQDTKRFAQLRLKALDEPLDVPEREEMAQLAARLDAAEAAQLAPGMSRLQREHQRVRQGVASAEQSSQQLIQLLRQQAQLVTDAQRWIDEFEQRERSLHQQVAKLQAAGVLPSP